MKKKIEEGYLKKKEKKKKKKKKKGVLILKYNSKYSFLSI